jgi:hypothetical protein
MRKWEYILAYLDTSLEVQSINDELNDLGRDGWELVAVAPHKSKASGKRLVAMLKRRASSKSSVSLVG